MCDAVKLDQMLESKASQSYLLQTTSLANQNISGLIKQWNHFATFGVKKTSDVLLILIYWCNNNNYNNSK